VIHVFGCTGDRDKDKRPVMGRMAAELADKIILTHEDTYKEDPDKIIGEIELGVKKGGKKLDKTYWKVADRRKAIRKAIMMAEETDVVLITGVGHQTTLNLGGKEVPWSDQKEAKKAIKSRLREDEA
jgi:UDP-N-acetylmuramyl tripeptide synthase